MDDKSDEELDPERDDYEMLFKYINIEAIQTDDKTELMRSLNNVEESEIDIFNQEAIQAIIDYKWQVYGLNFFLSKFYLYILYMFTLYYDLETLNEDFKNGKRTKDIWFIIRKSVCFLIQLIFIIYEIIQFKKDMIDYIHDYWNYIEFCSISLFIWASSLDMLWEEISDLCRVIYVCCLIFSLLKIIYLVRVFKNMSKLVMMITQVIYDMKYFMGLFFFFVLTFAECYHLLGVDASSYGRMPVLLAHFYSTLRSAMGDFSLINPFEGFDICINGKHPTDPHKCLNDEYVHSYSIVTFTWVIFILGAFFLTLIFMNFIISVIGSSYAVVTEN